MTAILKILDVVPGWLYALALAILLAGAGVQTVRLDGAEVTVAQRDTTIAQLRAAIAQNKADASAELAKQTGLTLKAERDLGALRVTLETKDATNRQTVAALERRLADAAAAHGGRLRDPNAAAGCGGGGGGAAGPAAPGADSRPAGDSEAGGLFSAGATELLERLTREADEVNSAYASCRTDSLNIRATPPP